MTTTEWIIVAGLVLFLFRAIVAVIRCGKPCETYDVGP